jgi:hypothetical protein
MLGLGRIFLFEDKYKAVRLANDIQERCFCMGRGEKAIGLGPNFDLYYFAAMKSPFSKVHSATQEYTWRFFSIIPVLPTGRCTSAAEYSKQKCRY